MLTVVLTSSYITIQNSRPAQAESLLYRVGCAVETLLTGSCLANSSETEPNQQPTSPATPNNTTESPEQPVSTTGEQPTTAPQPIEFNQSLYEMLPTISPVKDMYTDYVAYTFPSFQSGNGDRSSVLGAQDSGALIAATRHGWEIIGVAWYWWVTALASIVGLSVGIKLLLTKSLLGIVK